MNYLYISEELYCVYDFEVKTGLISLAATLSKVSSLRRFTYENSAWEVHFDLTNSCLFVVTCLIVDIDDFWTIKHRILMIDSFIAVVPFVTF